MMVTSDPSPPDQLVVGLGEVLWDCFADGRRLGGAPANVAFHAAQLGHPAAVVSRVGDDRDGAELRAALADHGLPIDTIQIDPDHPTSRVTVDTRDPNHPSYVIHHPVAWDFLVFDDQVEAVLRSAAAVCFGTLAQREPAARRTIHQCLAAAGHALRVYDVNLRQDWYSQETIGASLAAADWVKLNLDEVGLLVDLLNLPADPLPAFCRELARRFDLDGVCITRGAGGCLVVGADESVDEPGRPVKVVDAVGAGDAFTAALIAACLRGWPLAVTARFANAVGGLVAGRAGAMPAVGDDLLTFLREAEPQ